MTGEFALIAAIRERLATDDPHVELGIGDDAAVLAPSAGAVISVDAAVEGVHFDRRWLTGPELGARAYVAAFSDLAAMNARPIAGLVAFVLPRSLEDEHVLAIVDGIAAASREYGAPIVGGNVATGSELSITTTAIGERRDRVLTRSGARIGDGLYVSGAVGAAALGWRLLARGRSDEPFVSRWRRPRARFDLGALLVSASAAIDVSDGLLSDLAHVCAASEVGARVQLEAVPTEAGHEPIARSIGEDPDGLALAGGEEYELLFTSAAPVDPALATRIGTITAGPIVVTKHGVPVPVVPAGYTHR